MSDFWTEFVDSGMSVACDKERGIAVGFWVIIIVAMLHRPIQPCMHGDGYTKALRYGKTERSTWCNSICSMSDLQRNIQIGTLRCFMLCSKFSLVANHP